MQKMMPLGFVNLGAWQERAHSLGLFWLNPAQVDPIDVGGMLFDEWPSENFELGREALGFFPELEVTPIRDFLELNIAQYFTGCRIGYGHVCVVTGMQGEGQGHFVSKVCR
jgi:hypothetical protein